MENLLTTLQALIQYPSITPHDAECQAYMIDYLKNLGFECQAYDALPVANFFARMGHGAPFLLFAGHTDIVDPGLLSEWKSDPFTLTRHQQHYIGRGVADMKGALACMLDAVTLFLKNYDTTFQGSLGFLITSGEEGDYYHLGTPHVMRVLNENNSLPDYCILGEPSSQKVIGDMIKIGRRGSINAQITILGKQGHVAYPHLALNPVTIAAPVIHALSTLVWDHGNDWFPPTNLQITHLETSSDSFNVIPAELSFKLNCRFSNEQTAEKIQKTVENVFKKHQVDAKIQWRLSGEPFLTPQGHLLDSTIQAIEAITGQRPILSTTGGTSDGRFIAPYGIEVIELGLCCDTIHQINESIEADSLTALRDIYLKICEKIFVSVHAVARKSNI